MLRRVFFIILAIFPLYSFAASPVGIPSSGIWFSKEPFFAGEEITVSTVVFNSGSSTINGVVEFLDKDQLVEKKDISLSAFDNKIVSFKFTVSEGKHTFKMRIADNDPSAKSGAANISPSTYYSSKTGVVTKEVLKDTDSDGISDIEDNDIDGDSLTNAEEKKLGTDPRKTDTDGDGILDNVDKRPLRVDVVTSSVDSITASDTKKVFDSVEKVVPKSVVAPVVSVATPVIGAVESFRVNQANNNNNRVDNTIDGIIKEVGTAKVLGASTESANSASSTVTKTGKPTGWKVFMNGMKNSDQLVKTPFGYIKLLFFLILQFLLTHTFVFYIFLILVIIKILITIKRLIFNRGE